MPARARHVHRDRMVHRDPRPPSRLERRFAALWDKVGGPPLEAEFRFHPQRRWRADFAHLPSRTLIEIEGGIYVQGRHNRAAGFAADLEIRAERERQPQAARRATRGRVGNSLEAALDGWRVVRLGPAELTLQVVGRLVSLLDGSAPPAA